jgi:inward rectifier potassium channel
MADPTTGDGRDLGLGARLTDQSRTRVLNPDGTFNVRRRGVSFLQSLNAFHYLMTISSVRFFALVAGIYFLTNLLFAAGYYACGPNGFTGANGFSSGERFLDCFFFSVQTLATIGYGKVSPNSVSTNLLVTVEALTGLTAFTLITGIVFSRFSRPTAAIVFSRTAVVAPYENGTGFMFRVANGRTNQLTELEATVNFSRMEDDEGRRAREFYQLKLERKKITFFPLHWVIVHPIDQDSPLFGVTPEQLTASDAEFFILLSGTDETFSQVVQARSSYRPSEVVWNMKFADMYLKEPDGVPGVDLRKLHDVVNVN